MKTITEFSGTVLREAARIRMTHLAAVPVQQVEAAPPAVAPPPNDAAGDAPETAAEAPVESAGGEATASEAAADAAAETPAEPDMEASTGSDEGADASAVEATPEGEAAPAEATPVEAAPVEADPAIKAADDAARAEVESAMGIKEDRLARLFEALDSVKNRADNVRLVRVLQGEDPPANGRKVGDHVYVADLMPAASKGRRDERDARGGDRKGGRGFGGGGGGGGGRPGGGGGPGGAGGGPRGRNEIAPRARLGSGCSGGRSGLDGDPRPDERSCSRRPARASSAAASRGWRSRS
jgi:translation initiation factor IF-2